MDLLSGLVRDIRGLLDAKAGADRNRRLLVTRVPANIDRCRRVGIDVETWIADGLVDLLSIGRCYVPFFARQVEITNRWGEAVVLRRPHVDPELCIGCGICEHACPVTDLRAIRVTAVGETRSRERSLWLRADAAPDADATQVSGSETR